jgi:hypothetical protein
VLLRLQQQEQPLAVVEQISQAKRAEQVFPFLVLLLVSLLQRQPSLLSNPLLALVAQAQPLQRQQRRQGQRLRLHSPRKLQQRQPRLRVLLKASKLLWKEHKQHKAL